MTQDGLVQSVPYLQILEESGKVNSELEPKLDKKTLLKIYRTMMLSRELDQKMLNMQRQGRLGTFHPPPVRRLSP